MSGDQSAALLWRDLDVLSVVEITHIVGVRSKITGWRFRTLVGTGDDRICSHLVIVDIPGSKVMQEFGLTCI